MFIKICGLQRASEVNAAVSNGADAIGFVFAESVRRVTPEQAAALSAEIPDNIVRVAVMLHPTAKEWDDVRTVFRPDWLQTDVGDLGELDIGACTTALPVLRDNEAMDIAVVERYDRVLFEGSKSGQGQPVDWALAARVAAETPTVLAGGLNPDNVGQAIQQVMPWGVDVSSGVEGSPGVKSAAKIAAFISAARKAENEVDAKH